MGPLVDRMTHILAARFAPEVLTVTDESAQHAGHSGVRPGGQTHFRIYMVSNAFEGLSRVARHRAVYAALGAEMQQIHALALTLLVPGEATKES